MKKLSLIALFALAMTLASAQDGGAQTPPPANEEKPTSSVKPAAADPVLVSVSAKGHDVRVVLHEMFKQAEKSFVLEPNIRHGLYLSLEKIEFEEALRLVGKMAELSIDVQNGIYFISQKKSAKPDTAVKGAFEAKPAPKGKLATSVLAKRLTTRFDKVDIRKLIANLTEQTGVAFEVADDVPNYKLDAYLLNTSLKFALDTICAATKLQYKFTDNLSIAITKEEPKAGVKVVDGS